RPGMGEGPESRSGSQPVPAAGAAPGAGGASPGADGAAPGAGGASPGAGGAAPGAGGAAPGAGGAAPGAGGAAPGAGGAAPGAGGAAPGAGGAAPGAGGAAPRDVRDALVAFAVACAAVAALAALGGAVPLVGRNLGALVAVVFLYLPFFFAWRRSEDLASHGFHAAPVGKGLLLGLGAPLVIFPL